MDGEHQRDSDGADSIERGIPDLAGLPRCGFRVTGGALAGFFARHCRRF